jgi:hypothetical protein
VELIGFSGDAETARRNLTKAADILKGEGVDEVTSTPLVQPDLGPHTSLLVIIKPRSLP